MAIFTDIDLHPNIQKFLPNIDESILFYKNYGLKHPGAIMNTSIGKIESGVRDFLDSYDLFIKTISEDSKEDHITIVLKNYRQLLYIFREYVDDSYHIIKTFIKPQSKMKGGKNQYHWLQLNAKITTQDFLDNTLEYREYIDASVNEMKHNNAILGSHTFYSDYTPDVCAGYFIANVVDNCYEPIQKIHKKYMDTDTGFSFRRDLTYNLYNVYFIAEEMQKLLSEKLHMDFSQIPKRLQEAPPERYKLFERIMNLPKIHFPDEYIKPVPSISLTDKRILKLEYPSHLTIKVNRLEKIMLTHSTDGYTGCYRILYAK